MKKLSLILFLILPFVGNGQDMKVKWDDDNGREFSIRVLSGGFEYSMIPGDRLSYTYDGNISMIGNVRVSYTYDGKVSRVGSVRISYTYDGKVSRVGGLSISYTYDGKVSRTSGRVRY